jgi:hypothetical protein
MFGKCLRRAIWIALMLVCVASLWGGTSVARAGTVLSASVTGDGGTGIAQLDPGFAPNSVSAYLDFTTIGTLSINLTFAAGSSGATFLNLMCLGNGGGGCNNSLSDAGIYNNTGYSPLAIAVTAQPGGEFYYASGIGSVGDPFTFNMDGPTLVSQTLFINNSGVTSESLTFTVVPPEGYVPPTNTPEPSSALLFMTPILLGAAVRGRRVRTFQPSYTQEVCSRRR